MKYWGIILLFALLCGCGGGRGSGKFKGINLYVIEGSVSKTQAADMFKEVQSKLFFEYGVEVWVDKIKKIRRPECLKLGKPSVQKQLNILHCLQSSAGKGELRQRGRVMYYLVPPFSDGSQGGAASGVCKLRGTAYNNAGPSGLDHAERLMLHELLHILGYLDRDHSDNHAVNLANMYTCLGMK